MPTPVSGSPTPPVSPASPTAPKPTKPVTANPGGAMGKDQFLQLLVAQMKNQDPLNPADGMQMATQLAQFSTVEQLQSANDTLTQIANATRVAKQGTTASPTTGA